jgi:hypothetical protein
MLRIALIALLIASCQAQAPPDSPSTQKKKSDEQINVNWLYGSYVPKGVQMESLNGKQRFALYVNQTYTTPGIYVKTILFASRDQIADRNPQWGQGIEGYAKRLGDRHLQSIIQNSIASSGNAVLGWEPRYDRCKCDGFWLRTRHAVVRNFVTYDRSEKSLRPQLMPYVGAFGSSALATTWQGENASWTVRGYQAAITQVFVGSAINWVGEFAPEIFGVFHKKKKPSK